MSTASLMIGVAADPDHEQAEPTEIYVLRGLDRPLAATVAERLMEADPLGSHVRDELGLQPGRLARPLQAAVVSAVSFAVGGGPPTGAHHGRPDQCPDPGYGAGGAALLARLGALAPGLVVPEPGGRRCG